MGDGVVVLQMDDVRFIGIIVYIIGVLIPLTLSKNS